MTRPLPRLHTCAPFWASLGIFLATAGSARADDAAAAQEGESAAEEATATAEEATATAEATATTAGEGAIAPAAPAPEEGWKARLDMGGNFSLAHNSNVVGIKDGVNLQIGALLDGDLSWTSGPHRWVNAMRLQQSRTRTPEISELLRTIDVFELSTLYELALTDPAWLGPYARARLQTALFEGFTVSPEDLTVRRSFRNGTVTDTTADAQSRIGLTESFEPTVIREGLGAYLRPAAEPHLTFSGRLGGALQHVLAADGFALDDDAGTAGILELRQLQGSSQLGLEAEGVAEGLLNQDAKWRLKTNFFYPLHSTREGDARGLGDTNVEVEGTLKVKLADWASLDYTLTAKRIPAVVDAWQVQNGLLLNVGFSLL